MPDKPVDVWFIGFGDSSLTIRVRWWVASFTEKRRVSDRVNAAIKDAAEQAKIDLPNPIMDNNLTLRVENGNGVAKALGELS